MRFGPAGVPLQCEERSSYAAVKCINKLGLNALELQFVRGVKMSESLAKEVEHFLKNNPDISAKVGKEKSHQVFLSDQPYNLKKISKICFQEEIKPTINDPF